MVWKKIVNEERTWSFGPGGSKDNSNWMGGSSGNGHDDYSRAKKNVDAVVQGGKIVIDSLNLTNTRHQELDRRDRDSSIDNEAGGLGREIVAVYFVDKGHPAGPELHWITDNAIILITNAFKNNGLNVNTKLTARPGQLYRYPEGGNQNMLDCRQVFPARDWQVPQSLIGKARKNQEMGLNYRENTNMKCKLCKEEIDLGWDYEAKRDFQDMAQRTMDADLARKVIFNGEPMTKEQAIKKTRQMFFNYEIEHPEASMASALSKVKAMKDGDEIEVKPSDFDSKSYQESEDSKIYIKVEDDEHGDEYWLCVHNGEQFLSRKFQNASAADSVKQAKYWRLMAKNLALDNGIGFRPKASCWTRKDGEFVKVNFTGGNEIKMESGENKEDSDSKWEIHLIELIDRYQKDMVARKTGDRTAGMALSMTMRKIDKIVESHSISSAKFHELLDNYVQEMVGKAMGDRTAGLAAGAAYDKLIDYIVQI